MNKILITGSSGFIGFHLSNKLSKKNLVLGIDNHNRYYSNILKKKRLNMLLKNKKFYFKKINLNDKKKLEKIFKIFQPNIVYHLAGQPGVLYSFKNPKSYVINNVNATHCICKLSKKYNIKKFIFGSSSSVYGDQKNFPISENFKLKPKNPYAKTKLKSEKIVTKMFSNSKTKFIIFRFFTVYGPFGRPDMFIHKLLNSIKNKNKIYLHNYGLNHRDFTYVEDVITILIRAIKINPKKKILNICRSSPIITTKLVDLISKYYNKVNKIYKKGAVKGEMLKTHGSNNLLKKNFKKIKFTDIRFGLKKTIFSFKKYKF